MSDRERAMARARVLAAARPDSARVEVDGPDRATAIRGRARLALRARPGALPFRSGSLDHVVAVGVVKQATGEGRGAIFAEIQRALRDGGSFVYGEADADGTFAKDHLALREMGLVPAPMDTIPELSHVPWRLLAAFKPHVKSTESAERGHTTH